MSVCKPFSLKAQSISHSEHACFGVLNRRIQRDSHAEAEHSAQVRRFDDSVVPQPRRGIVRAALLLVVRHDSVLELLYFGRVTLILKLDE